MARYVVWDWNGTLLDDLSCAISVTNTMLTEFGLPLLGGVDDYRAKFRFPVVDYYTDLGFDTAEHSFAAASRRYHELYLPAAGACGLHDGARDALAKLHRAGLGQMVISASQQDYLTAQLEPFCLEAWLDGALGIADIYAASKYALAERWLDGSGLSADEVLFVGDSQHDFEIAQTLGARCVLFSGGHQPRSLLASLGAPVVDSLRDVPRFALEA